MPISIKLTQCVPENLQNKIPEYEASQYLLLIEKIAHYVFSADFKEIVKK